MPFDPTKPANNSPLDAAEMRDQLNSLKTLMENLVPIGAVIAWFKNTPGVPALPPNFVECNGQLLTDPESLLDGQLMPDLNTGIERFIRGNLVSGLTGGIATFATASADNAGVGPTFNAVTTDYSPGAVPIPPYQTAVFVIRVK